MVIVHIAKINLNYESGMGRISSMWRDEFVKQGHQFHHIGDKEVNANVHILQWGKIARQYLESLNLQPDVVLVHEPFGGYFISKHFKTVIFSHGIEERAWAINKQYQFLKLSLKSRLLPDYIRFRSNNQGFKNAHRMLLSNTTDKAYLIKKGIKEDRITIFKNGYYPFDIDTNKQGKEIVFLYNATWIERKGKYLVYKAFNTILLNQGVRLILAGIGKEADTVLNGFDESVRNNITVIPRFNADEEKQLYNTANVFLMPSYFEGQSLALTQAMAMGLCPIAADNCGQIDFINPNINGLLFKTGDIDDFTGQLQWIIDHPEKIREYGSAAKKSVEGLLWDSVSKEVVNNCVSLIR